MRILADTSIWINHFRRSDSRLVQALSQQQVLIHPIVIGELATGKLRDRPGILADLQALPRIEEVTFTESQLSRNAPALRVRIGMERHPIARLRAAERRFSLVIRQTT